MFRKTKKPFITGPEPSSISPPESWGGLFSLNIRRELYRWPLGARSAASLESDSPQWQRYASESSGTKKLAHDLGEVSEHQKYTFSNEVNWNTVCCGSWKWWNCGPKDNLRVYRNAYSVLREKSNLHNLIFACVFQRAVPSLNHKSSLSGIELHAVFSLVF